MPESVSLKALLKSSYFAKQNKLCIILAWTWGCISCLQMNSWWLRPVPWASTEPSTHWEIENCEGQQPSRDVGHKSRKERGLWAGWEHAEGLGYFCWSHRVNHLNLKDCSLKVPEGLKGFSGSEPQQHIRGSWGFLNPHLISTPDQ